MNILHLRRDSERTSITFIPETESIAAIIAAPGGLLVLAWVILLGITLFGLSKSDADFSLSNRTN
ncbi:MAG: hypothetical protein ACFFDI_22050 [Promethearchaeota archaeon]